MGQAYASGGAVHACRLASVCDTDAKGRAMSQNLEALEAQLKAKLPYFKYMRADLDESRIRMVFRKKTWHDNLFLIMYVTDELLDAPDAIIKFIEDQLPYEVRSAAARYGWQRRKMLSN